MLSNSSWVPHESPQALFSERCQLQGAIIGAIAYGISLSLYFSSVHLLSRSRNGALFRQRIFLLIFITMCFLLVSLYMFSLAAFTQMAFIHYRNYPGGPSAFETDMASIPINAAGNAAFVLANWLCNAFVVWRFKVVYWDSQIPAWSLMALPCLVFAGSVALGIMFIVQVSVAHPDLANDTDVTLPYLGLSLSINIILTIAIAVRLLTFRRRVTTLLGRGHGTRYTSVAAIAIESAALSATMSIALLILRGIGNALSHVFLQSLGQFQTIAVLLIVFRLAQGKGWTEESMIRVMAAETEDGAELGKMQFATRATRTGSMASTSDSLGHPGSASVEGDVFGAKQTA